MTGVLGDARDLTDLLTWAEGFFVLDETSADGDFAWDHEVRLIVADASVTLCKAFTSMELAHRQAHRLTGKKEMVY